MIAICIKDLKVVGLSVFTFKKGVKYELTPGTLNSGTVHQLEYFYYECNGYAATISKSNFNDHFISIDEHRDSIINKVFK